MSTNHRRTLFLALSVAAVVFLTNLKALSSFDVWYHLSLGRSIAETGDLPSRNILSYTAPDHPAPPLSWLFQWWIFQLHQVGGATAIVLFRALCLAGIFALLVVTADARRADVTAILVLLGLVALAARSRFVDRPHVPGDLLMVAQVCLLEWYRRLFTGRGTQGGPKPGRGVLLLVSLAVLQALWVNVHGSAVLGVVIASAYALGALLDRAVLREAYPNRPLGVLLLSPLVAIAASGLNPMGWQILTYPLTHARSLQALNLKDFFVERVALRASDLYGDQWPFALMVLLCAVGLVVSARRLCFIDLGLLCSIGAAILSARFVGEVVLLISPVAAGLLSPLFAHERFRFLEPAKHRAMIGGVLFLAMSMGATISDARPWGFRPDAREYPISAADYLDSLGEPGPMFNDFEFGGYLAWRGYKVFIDSRGPGFYPEDLLQKYVSVIDRRFPDEASKALSALEEEYGFTVAIVHHYMADKLFRERRDWRLAYSDAVARVFVKERGGDTAP